MAKLDREHRFMEAEHRAGFFPSFWKYFKGHAYTGKGRGADFSNLVKKRRVRIYSLFGLENS